MITEKGNRKFYNIWPPRFYTHQQDTYGSGTRASGSQLLWRFRYWKILVHHSFGLTMDTPIPKLWTISYDPYFMDHISYGPNRTIKYRYEFDDSWLGVYFIISINIQYQTIFDLCCNHNKSVDINMSVRAPRAPLMRSSGFKEPLKSLQRVFWWYIIWSMTWLMLETRIGVVGYRSIYGLVEWPFWPWSAN